ncbi:CPT1B palmitoyltransferase, partial [Casuarius casuarius]|nr:CPT1B palmitoyltransferase [Casuarius casuarius]
MAEAHQAVAFQFTVTPEGFDFHLSREALKQLYLAGVYSWKKRLVCAKNSFLSGVYPASPSSWMVVVMATAGSFYCQLDPSMGVIARIRCCLPGSRFLSFQGQTVVSAALFSTGVWLAAVLLCRHSLKLLLSYHGWMFEPHGKMSRGTKIWAALVKVLSGRKPLLYSFQTSLPRLPVPPVEATVTRYLESVRPLMDEEKYRRMEALAKEFKEKTAPQLQKYLILKSWWTTNYVSAQPRRATPVPPSAGDPAPGGGSSPRCPGPAGVLGGGHMGTVPPHGPGAPGEPRGAGVSGTLGATSAWPWGEEGTPPPPIPCPIPVSHPIAVPHLLSHLFLLPPVPQPIPVPYQFQLGYDDGGHCRGEPNTQLAPPQRLQWDIPQEVGPAPRRRWAPAEPASPPALAPRPCTLGSPHPIQPHGIGAGSMPPVQPPSPTASAQAPCPMQPHGIGAGSVPPSPPCSGVAPWHSWGSARGAGSRHALPCDALPERPAVPGAWHGLGGPAGPAGRLAATPCPSPQCQDAIERSYRVAKALADDVDFCCFQFSQFGKGLIKQCRTSPDAFIQLSLQLAHFRDKGCFCLTYEASMTRLFREGRTETVRSCTAESTAFVRSMADARQSRAERKRLFKLAADKHQHMYRMAMTGAGIDRHLFCLYVVSRYLGVQSPFLAQVLAEPWRLSTSQTPQQQLKMFDLDKHPDHVSTGGGFGPVSTRGPGV